MSDALLITCEHGGNRIPAPFRELFAARQGLLHTHRRYDAGGAPWNELRRVVVRSLRDTLKTPGDS